MIRRTVTVLAAMAAVATLTGIVGGEAPKLVSKKRMVTYNTPHYVLTTDIPEALVREADLRMTRMFEEYRRRTAAFSGEPKVKFPFFMFTEREDYISAGAPASSVGVFMPMSGKLMAYAEEDRDAETWHIVQHEGFHQFAAMTIRMGMPPWLNEGLAEYFGEALFSGDCFIAGTIPSWRLKELKGEIAEKKWKAFSAMTTMTQEEWNGRMSFTNYTQAWAMVHFLVHGEGGKYQKPFDQYIMMLNKGAGEAEAWASVFGRDVAGFQKKCEKWWTELPENPTMDVYARANVATMTSLLARSELQKKNVADFDALLAAPVPTDVKLPRELWLPPLLVEHVLKAVPKMGTWSIVRMKGQAPKVVCVLPGLGTATGTYTLAGNRVDKVSVSFVPESAATTKPE